MKDTIKIRWVLAHEPIELFVRAAEQFSRDLKKKTGDRVQVEVMTLSQYAERYNDGKKVSKFDLLDHMEAGRLEMSQMFTTTLGKYHKDMFALDLPFLFRDHDHAAKVLDGPIGKELLTNLTKTSNIQGLAFTYSGGFRMIAASSPIRKVEDFQGLKIRIARSPIAAETFRSVGATPVEMELEDINEAIAKGEIQGGESTYPRFYSMKQNEVSQVINDTRHSLFLTSIIVNKNFWAGLDEDIRTVIHEASLSAARLERAESVQDIETVQGLCKKDGIPVVEISGAEQERFKTATQKVYDKFRDFFSQGLISRIQTH